MEGQLFPGMSDVSQHLAFLVYAPFSGRNHLSVPGIHGVSNPSFYLKGQEQVNFKTIS